MGVFKPGARVPFPRSCLLPLAAVCFGCAAVPAVLLAQAPTSAPQVPQVGVIFVAVSDGGGGSFPNLATVEVYKKSQGLYSTATVSSGRTRFEGVPLGTYVVVANSPGFDEAREEVELMLVNDQAQVRLMLRVTGDPSSKPVASGPPLLAPRVQKEIAKALEALRARKFEEARKHLLTAEKFAPTHPDVKYLLGVLSSLSGNAVLACSYWEKAIGAYATHLSSLLALGEARLAQENLAEARSLVDRAVSADASSWRAHQLLAHVLLRQGAYADAQHQAELALELGKADAGAVRLLLAKSLVAQRKRPEAVRVLQGFLASGPPELQAASAKRLLQALEQPAGETRAAAPELAALAEPVPAALPVLPRPPAKWFPPNVDDAVPPVEAAACDLPALLRGAARGVVAFTKSVDRFTATEFLEHQLLDDKGLAIRSESRKFDYLVSIRELRPGILNVDEYRNGSMLANVFPDGIATWGLPSVLLLFHPVNAGNYEFTCEGLSAQRGIPAWQVHFREKEANRAPLRTYRIGMALFPIPLKGRAWIAQSGFEVLRIETDLREAVPQIRLLAEHQAIDYGPVRFQKNRTELWLPAATDFFLDFRGQHIHRRLSYAGYLLFSVDQNQRITAPPASDTPAN